MKVEVNGDKMVITIDVSAAALKAALPSSTGKTRTVATTHGFSRYQTPAGEVALSLNASTK